MKSVAMVVGAAILVAAVLGFKREYVIESSGLVGVRHAASAGKIVVTGSLLASSAKIAKTTVTNYDGDILIRVYAEQILEDDDPDRIAGTFAVPVILTPDVQRILIGDRSSSMTVGAFLGIPLRVPRIPRDAAAEKEVWRRHAATR